MRVLVAGAGGQLGAALLVAAPAGVVATGLDRASLDIASQASIAAAVQAHRPDILINAAAYTAVDAAEQDADAAFAANALGPTMLARTCRAQAIRLVHVSTDFVFDGTLSRPYRPNDPPAPLGVYGASKHAGEVAIRAEFPEAAIVRTSWVYGTNGANFLTTMVRVMRARGGVRVVSDQIGTPTHTASLARALWTIARGDFAGIAHWADAGTASWYDFAIAIAEEAISRGLLPETVSVEPIMTADYPTPARRPSYSVFDRSSGWMAGGGVARHWREELRDAIQRLEN